MRDEGQALILRCGVEFWDCCAMFGVGGYHVFTRKASSRKSRGIRGSCQ